MKRRRPSQRSAVFDVPFCYSLPETDLPFSLLFIPFSVFLGTTEVAKPWFKDQD